MTTKRETRNKVTDELRGEYSLDYSRARPNRFATRMATGSVAVVLDPDVALVFRTAASVNKLLRSVISAIPRGNGASKSPVAERSNKRVQRTRGKRA